MKVAAAGLICLAISGMAHAGKSVDQCEAEIGEAAETNRQLVADCLLEAIGGAVNSPRNPNVYVVDFGIRKVNSANGVEPFAEFTNPNEASAIKYITITLTLYNAVGDMIASSIGGGTTKVIRFTGPLPHTVASQTVDWGPIWYNGTAECITMQSLGVEFMNGKKLHLSGKSLRKAIAADVKNSCRVQ